MKLYEIGNDLELLVERIEASGGEIDDEIAEALGSLEGAFREKAERVALAIKQSEALAAGIEVERKRLQARESAAARTAQSLKGYLEVELRRAGMKKVATDLVTLRFQRNSSPAIQLKPGVELTDLDEDFIRRPEPELNRKAVADAWRASGANADERVAPAGLIVEVGDHLRIK